MTIFKNRKFKNSLDSVCFLFFRFYELHFHTFIWRAAATATLTSFRFMMGTVLQPTKLENTVAKITRRSSIAPTIHCISGFALTTQSVVVASQLLGSLRTQVGVLLTSVKLKGIPLKVLRLREIHQDFMKCTYIQIDRFTLLSPSWEVSFMCVSLSFIFPS